VTAEYVYEKRVMDIMKASLVVLWCTLAVCRSAVDSPYVPASNLSVADIVIHRNLFTNFDPRWIMGAYYSLNHATHYEYHAPIIQDKPRPAKGH